MRRLLPVLLLALVWAGPAPARGLLIPQTPDVPPLEMRSHQVTVTIEDQVAVTRVEQVFRNHTDRPLEATYVFPVPKGASVKKFTMWVDGKEVKGELVEADRARQVYTDIVRRTQDPGLLEYLGNNLLRLRVFPVPARGDQKLSLSYTSVAERDAGLVEYVYPLKTDGQPARTQEKFSIAVSLKSQQPIQNVYSPTHAITVKRPNDRTAHVSFERDQACLDKDFQLFYTPADKDVGLTALPHRPVKSADGYFMLLIAPRAELSRTHHVARDMVFVLDTSSSMAGPKMEQARKALHFCLGQLDPRDRFALMNFATTVNPFSDKLVKAGRDQVRQARRWVDRLEACGGTAIDDALQAALRMRPADTSRPFTVVFFTDGQPTVGETSPEKILANVSARNTHNTRIFTFGVGDDVNAVLLDRLADQTRAVSTYVRPEEDIEVKVGSLYGKISHPVLTNLKLTAGRGIRLAEVYPAQLPDLFHGSQVVVLGRYHGKGHTALTLTGNVGKKTREFIYEVNFPAKTNEDRAFVEDLWARRKVGYLLDQIRQNGEKKELVDEVVALAKKHGITTPYTSYLVVPDGQPPAANNTPAQATEYTLQTMPGGAHAGGGGFGGGAGGYRASPPAPSFSAPALGAVIPQSAAAAGPDPAVNQTISNNTAGRSMPQDAPQAPAAYTRIRSALARGEQADLQTGKLGVDFAEQLSSLRNQNQLGQKASRQAAGRNCVDLSGAWVDDGYSAKMKTVTVKAQSEAYFRILERHPEVKEVFQLGNRLVWVTPSNVALVIDIKNGKEQMTDAEIDQMFIAAK
jgi:Ca-activated chloride channel family protein